MALVDDLLDLQDSVEEEFIPRLTDTLIPGLDAAVSLVRKPVPEPLPRSFRESLTQTLAALWRESSIGAANILISHFEDGFKSFKAARDANLNTIISDYIDNYGARQAAQIIRTTQIQIRDLAAGGLARGEAQEAVFGNIVNKIPDIAKGRATIITRTEAHAAAQYASQRVAERSEKTLKKVWTSVNDERTRDFFGNIDEFNHRVMHGVSVALGGPFQVPNKRGGFDPIMFPGDPNGSAGNIINCRCVQTYVSVDGG